MSPQTNSLRYRSIPLIIGFTINIEIWVKYNQSFLIRLGKLGAEFVQKKHPSLNVKTSTDETWFLFSNW